MAGTITHAYFSLDLYDKLSIRSKELLVDQKESLKVFSQSTDVLFFYNLVSLKKGKKIRDFGVFTQKAKSYEFFSTLINYIKYNDLIYNPEVIAYLYGMLSHYVLDSTIHPYIIYQTGVFNKKAKNTYKYNMLHEQLETYIDNYFISIREGIKPNKFKCYKYCFKIDDLDKDLVEVIDFTYKQVFGIDSFHKYYLKSIKQMKSFYKVFRYDPIGIKKIFYNLIDLICPRNMLRKSPLSYKMKSMKDYLNLEHNIWYNPTDKKIKSNESVIELYTKALDKTANMINEINQFFYYDKRINLEKVIGNLSYVHGRSLDKKRELKYFKF